MCLSCWRFFKSFVGALGEILTQQIRARAGRLHSSLTRSCSHANPTHSDPSRLSALARGFPSGSLTLAGPPWISPSEAFFRQQPLLHAHTPPVRTLSTLHVFTGLLHIIFLPPKWQKVVMGYSASRTLYRMLIQLSFVRTNGISHPCPWGRYLSLSDLFQKSRGRWGPGIATPNWRRPGNK